MLIGAAVIALLGVLSVVGAVHQSTTTHNVRVLREGGITTAAEVLNSAYDPDGGDPNGWTKDTVQFHEPGGHIREATVGHHGDDHLERASGTIDVVYDPGHPAVVMNADELADSTPGTDLTVAMVFAAVVVLSALSLALSVLQFSMRRRAPE